VWQSFDDTGYGGFGCDPPFSGVGRPTQPGRAQKLTFGPTRGVLQALADGLAIDAGEPAARALGEGLDEPRGLLAVVAELYRRLYEHGNDVIVLLREGAATEPDLRDAVEAGLGRSRRSVAEPGARGGAVRVACVLSLPRWPATRRFSLGAGLRPEGLP
jgi:hypothetical protein